MGMIPIDQGQDYQDLNNQYDRITNILRSLAPVPTDSMQGVNILNAMVAGAGSPTGAGYSQSIQQQQTDQYNRARQAQDDSLNNEMNVAKVFEQKVANGDAKMKALYDKIKLFSGDDPVGNAMFINELHNDPETIDPSNSFQVMSKLAGIAQRTGYTPIDNKLKQAQIGHLNSPLDTQLKQAQIDEIKSKTLARSQTVQGSINPQTGEIIPTMPTKPLPPSALKQKNENLDILGIANSNNALLTDLSSKIDEGKIKLGPMNNFYNTGKNYLGNSTPESRQYSDLRASLEKLRNDSLRLNKGTQTEGDAVRAWNELFQNMNDSKVVSQRLKAIANNDAQIAEQKKNEINNIQYNYGQPAIDYSKYDKTTPLIQSKNTGVVKAEEYFK